MKPKKRKFISVIRTEVQLLKLLRYNRDNDIYYCATTNHYYWWERNKFWFVGICIDRRLMFKLLKENKVKPLVGEVNNTTEFLMQLALGTLTDDVKFYHVKRGVWRGGEQYLVEEKR